MDRAIKISDEQYTAIKKIAHEEDRSIKRILWRVVDEGLKKYFPNNKDKKNV